MELKAIFARHLRKRRAELGWSQEEVGERSGLTRNYIGMIERGETSPTLDAVEAISEAFGVKPSVMLDETS